MMATALPTMLLLFCRKSCPLPRPHTTSRHAAHRQRATGKWSLLSVSFSSAAACKIAIMHKIPDAEHSCPTDRFPFFSGDKNWSPQKEITLRQTGCTLPYQKGILLYKMYQKIETIKPFYDKGCISYRCSSLISCVKWMDFFPTNLCMDPLGKCKSTWQMQAELQAEATIETTLEAFVMAIDCKGTRNTQKQIQFNFQQRTQYKIHIFHASQQTEIKPNRK